MPLSVVKRDAINDGMPPANESTWTSPGVSVANGTTATTGNLATRAWAL